MAYGWKEYEPLNSRLTENLLCLDTRLTHAAATRQSSYVFLSLHCSDLKYCHSLIGGIRHSTAVEPTAFSQVSLIVRRNLCSVRVPDGEWNVRASCLQGATQPKLGLQLFVRFPRHQSLEPCVSTFVRLCSVIIFISVCFQKQRWEFISWHPELFQ